jgi:putative hemolysin
MPTGDGTLSDVIGILSILLLVAANGFFVAAEFSLVTVRRSRVAQLVAARRANAIGSCRVRMKPDTREAAGQERVEFAVKLPGRDATGGSAAY